MNSTRIMIVDDNPLNIELTTFVLSASDFVVESAVDAVDALKKVRAFQPDVILMDIQMPGMDGIELTQLLKSTAATSHIIIIAFTAFAMKGDEERLREAGCDGYLSKPIDVATFATQVRNCIALAGKDGASLH